MDKKGGLHFIRRHQRSNGGFAASTPAHSTKRYYTTFIPSLVALALHEVEGSEKIQADVAAFLHRQKSKEWTWNYWDRQSVEFRRTPYPDDVDDTVLALMHLWHHDADLFTPKIMAKIVSMLLAVETAPGGPYTTWLIGQSADAVWYDVDVIVNGNIAGFLKLQGVTLSAVEQLVERAIADKALHSPYYPGFLAGAYLTTRWYGGDLMPRLRKAIAVKAGREDHWGDPHHTALAVSALIRLGYPPRKLSVAMRYLAETQQSDGGWGAGPMYLEGTDAYGARTLTTALCLEAGSLYDKTTKEASAHIVSQPDPAYEATVGNIRLAVETAAQPELKESILSLLTRITAQDTDSQIVMLPYLVRKIFDSKVDSEVLQGLSTTSLWGWMAYTAFDDFLDEEASPPLLPAALFAFRHMMMSMRSVLPSDEPFQGEAANILDRLDAANAWEVAHCRGSVNKGVLSLGRLPDYGDLGQLADRSLGHAIGAVGVLYAAGYDTTSSEMVALRTFFYHYLIARQLNDDAHDWFDDLLRGHVNAVAVLVLRRWEESGRKRTVKDGINLRENSERLHLLMWESVIQTVSDMICSHVECARTAILSLAPRDTTALDLLILPLEVSAREALKKRADALEFIVAMEDAKDERV